MKTYMIGYDLNKPGKDYDGLIEAIKAMFDTWWHHLDSTWLVRTDLSAVDIRDALKAYLDSSDELLVSRISPDAAWTGFSSRGSSWLKDNL
jgi:hypothetical protein